MNKLLFVFCIFLLCCNVPPEGVSSESPMKENPQEILPELIAAYESENSISFLRYVAPNFQALNIKGGRLDSISLKTAIRDDFQILDGVRFQVFVSSVQKSREANQLKINIRWDRRAVITRTSQQWIVRNQNTELVFEKTALGWQLYSIRLDPIFGLADATGAITIDRGELDGKRIENPVIVR